ncbi:MAG TPA: DUF3108 domain-containing protein [Burkholderiales bacterium]|nr:DUF3108 domain-containing protein [Burkholderiales bacterium]
MIPAPLRHAGIAALALWTGAAQAVPPERITLTYELKRNSLVVDVSETLEHDGRTYVITSEGRGRGILALFGVLKRTSRGRITPQGLRPDEFRDERPGGWTVSAKFDWEARSVTQEKNGKSETLKMPATAQDPLSLAYSFAFVPPKGKEYDVMRADGRGLTPFRFTVVGTEKLATPAGEMQTLHIAKLRDGPEDKSTDIWFAAERDFLPVRVLVVETDGTRSDQVLTRMGK